MMSRWKTTIDFADARLRKTKLGILKKQGRGNMKVIFSDRAYASIMAETAEKIKTETGGLFLGVYEENKWYVIEAIDPGPQSIFEEAYFEYDQKYTQHLINKIANLYEMKLELIGLWHRHPGSMDVFSVTDGGTNSDYAKMRPEGAISALVNVDPDFRLTVYHVGRPCKYRKIEYETGTEKIPKKYLGLKTPDRFERIMKSRILTKAVSGKYHRAARLKPFMKLITPLLAERETDQRIQKHSEKDETVRNRIVDVLMSDILFMTEKLEIELSVFPQNSWVALLQNGLEGQEQLTVGYLESEKKFLFHYDGKNYLYEEGLFERLFMQQIKQRP